MHLYKRLYPVPTVPQPHRPSTVYVIFKKPNVYFTQSRFTWSILYIYSFLECKYGYAGCSHSTEHTLYVLGMYYDASNVVLNLNIGSKAIRMGCYTFSLAVFGQSHCLVVSCSIDSQVSLTYSLVMAHRLHMRCST